jgi:UDP-galactopyranose mutase
MAGAHAHPGPSLEAIGLATEAIAERLGAVPRRPATPA